MFFSTEFWIFLGIVLLAYNVTRGRMQNIVLLLASYGLYAYFDWQFLALLVGATTATWYIGRHLGPDAPGRQRWYLLGLVINLGMLLFFKYANFFASTLSSIFSAMGRPASPIELNILLPLGISFYTFRLLAYLFEVYNKRVRPDTPWLDLAVYISFFPQIASGPIERPPRFLPKLTATRRLDQAQLVTGLTYICAGIFYKIAIADPLASSTDLAFHAVTNLTSADALKAMILYSVRLYADFAGYSAIAIGVSTWFGLPAMDNFRQPYFAQSLIEFWTRWHISLSSWLRDYLFFPISRALLRRWGSDRVRQVQILSYFITMLATGIWHGAAWTFVVWGLLHGVYISVERFLVDYGPQPSDMGGLQRRINVLLNIFSTQFLVALAWVFFAAPNLPDAITFLQRLFSEIPMLSSQWWNAVLVPVTLLFGWDLLQFKARSIVDFWRLRVIWRVALLATLVVLILVLGGGTSEPFVYFRF